MPVANKQEFKMYENHPTIEPFIMTFNPKSSSYRYQVPKDRFPNIPRGVPIGVTGTLDVIHKDAIGHWMKMEAIKNIKRKLDPMNDGNYVLPETEELEAIFKGSQTVYEKKSDLGKKLGTATHDWLELFCRHKRDGDPMPDHWKPWDLPEEWKGAKKSQKFKILAKYYTIKVDELLEVMFGDSLRGDEEIGVELIADKYENDPWLFEDHLELMTLHNNLCNALKEFEAWFDDNDIEVINFERPVMSVRDGYAGTYDFIFRINGKLILGDFKTNNPSQDYPKGVFPTVFGQLGGYDLAYTEEFYPELFEQNSSPFDGYLCLNISKKSGKLNKEYAWADAEVDGKIVDELKINRAWFRATLGTKRGEQFNVKKLSMKYKKNQFKKGKK